MAPTDGRTDPDTHASAANAAISSSGLWGSAANIMTTSTMSAISNDVADIAVEAGASGQDCAVPLLLAPRFLPRLHA